MWTELGISGGTAIIILIALYFVIKWAVKNGIKEAYSAITGKKTDEDIQNEKELKELGLGFRHIAEKCKILLVHIVKGALDAGKISQFIGHGGKADALAKDNELPALCIAGKCNVIVDLLVNFHV